MLPHYARFARSLALLGGLGAAGCSTSNTLDPDAAAGTDAARVEDAFAAADSATPSDDAAVAVDADLCATCGCFGFTPEDAGVDAGVPDCNTIPGAEICCAAIGPLFPPDLAV